MNLTAIIEKNEYGFSAYIEQISGVNTQGETLEEIRDNLNDVLSIIADLKGIHNYKISKEVILDKSTTVHKTC
ncbi:TPA: type II toxin-antitoxin system HicB family antitoxin [Legionella pneumophila]|nr:type II toxin-antitoxin system HicB family antitoxin [Legionella pneumophila]